VISAFHDMRLGEVNALLQFCCGALENRAISR